MAQIHQAQLLQQQKLQQIASEANQKLLQQQKQNGLTGAIGKLQLQAFELHFLIELT